MKLVSYNIQNNRLQISRTKQEGVCYHRDSLQQFDIYTVQAYVETDVRKTHNTCSIASPLLTMLTPQLPFWYFRPWYCAPVGVVTTHFEKGSWFKLSSMTKRI